MRITQLKLKNIGVFEDQEIIFKEKTVQDKAEIHIFTGVNGSGKSTILYALASLFNFDLLIKRFRFFNDESWVKLLFDNRIMMELNYPKIQYYKAITNSGYETKKVRMIQEGINTLYFTEGSLEGILKPVQDFEDDYQPDIRLESFDGDNSEISEHDMEVYRYCFFLQREVMQNIEFKFALFAYSGSRSVSQVNIQSIQEIQNSPLEGSLNFDNPVNSHILLQWIANTQAKAAFAAQNGEKAKSEEYKSAISRIENAIKDIVGYDVHFLFNYEPFSVKVMVQGKKLDFDVLPDGLKSVVSWIADLLMRLERMKWKDNCNVLDRNFILFLDEIEIHLHPSWQRKILPVVQKLFKNAQIFIATHSPFVVASVSDAWIYKLTPSDGKTSLTEIVQSKAGFSYPVVMDEIFDMAEYFDIQTEADFKEFYRIKDEVLEKKEKNTDQFMEIAKNLSRKSPEISDIIGRELRQLARLTGRNFVL